MVKDHSDSEKRNPLPPHRLLLSIMWKGNVFLFNDALNTFYLRLYGVIHMVKDHSDNEKGNPLPPHRLLFPINSKGSFICTIPDRITHTTAFVTPIVEHWLEQEIAQWVRKKEGNVLINDAFNTFYLWLYGIRHRVKELFYLTTHSTHFIYGYMASGIW